MEKKANANERLWLLPYIMAPVIFFTRLSDAFTDNYNFQLLFAIFIGATSGLLGAGIYKLFQKKSFLVKLIVLIVFIALILLAYTFIKNYAETHYQ